MKLETGALLLLAGIGLYFVYTRVISSGVSVPVLASNPTIQPSQSQILDVTPAPPITVVSSRPLAKPGDLCSYGPTCNGEACSMIMIGGRLDSNLVCQPVHFSIPTFAIAASGGGAGQM